MIPVILSLPLLSLAPPPVLDSVELLDLSTGKWEAVAPLSSPRQGLVLVETAEGALAMGGLDTNYTLLATVEAFDPHTLSWSPAEDLKTARDFFAVTTVPQAMLPCP